MNPRPDVPLIPVEFLLFAGPAENTLDMITGECPRCDHGGKYLLKSNFSLNGTSVLQLVDEITSEQYHPTAEGVLIIGHDKHCQCRYSDIPKVAAVLVRFEDHDWILYDVRSSIVQVNGTTVPTGFALCDGDLLQIADVRLRIVGMKPLRRDRTDHQSKSSCMAECTAADGTTQTSKLNEACLIGTAKVCGMVFSNLSRLKTRHCLIVPYMQRWFVVNLTAGMAQHAGGPKWQTMAEIREKDVVRIGHLTVSMSIAVLQRDGETHSGVQDSDTDPVQSIVKPAITGRAEAEAFRPLEKTAKAYVPFRSDGSESYDGTAAEVADHALRLEPAEIPIDEVLSAAAQDVFNTAKARQLMVARTSGVLQSLTSGIKLAARLARLEEDFVDGRRLLALERMKSLLRDFPWNRSLLMSFARMCDSGGLPNLCLHTLNLVHRQLPNDVVVLKCMARISFLLARHEPRYFELSIKYWKRVQVLCPQEHHQITSTIRNISTEQTIAYRFFEKA